MPRPPQLQPNGFLAQKSVFKKHLMERIINLFEYTSNLIKGGGPAARAARATEPRHGPGEWRAGRRGPAWGKRGVGGLCVPSTPPPSPQPAGPLYISQKVSLLPAPSSGLKVTGFVTFFLMFNARAPRLLGFRPLRQVGHRQEPHAW